MPLVQPKLHFTKMHGLGNDFVVINALKTTIETAQLPIVELANRHVGVGFDQLLIIEPSQRADFYCRIFNADGSIAEQCGNGLRCVARLIHEEKLHSDSSFTIETKAGVFPIHVNDYDHISVTLGVPTVQEKMIEIALQHDPYAVNASILSLGNPHTIIKVDSVKQVLADQLASDISAQPLFPQGTNVGFMEVVNANHIRLRTIERGVGETHACGSNACAAICAGVINGWLNRTVEVEYRYGRLLIEWQEKNNAIIMTGPASRVFSGISFI